MGLSVLKGSTVAHILQRVARYHSTPRIICARINSNSVLTEDTFFKSPSAAADSFPTQAQMPGYVDDRRQKTFKD